MAVVNLVLPCIAGVIRELYMSYPIDTIELQILRPPYFAVKHQHQFVDAPQSRQSDAFGHQRSLSAHESWGNLDKYGCFSKLSKFGVARKPFVSLCKSMTHYGCSWDHVRNPGKSTTAMPFRHLQSHHVPVSLRGSHRLDLDVLGWKTRCCHQRCLKVSTDTCGLQRTCLL